MLKKNELAKKYKLMDYHYFVVYKGYGILSQFSPEEGSKFLCLRDAFPQLPLDIYPIGRLDADSEGLLILTNDKKLNQKILQPNQKIKKIYFVQLEGECLDSHLENLRIGVNIKLAQGDYFCKVANTKIIDPPIIPERNPPIRYRKNQQTTWAEIQITEGKNRQVRKMFAKIGFPVLRLIRVGIGGLFLDLKKEVNTYEAISKKEIGKVFI